jgi:predicted DNA binding protein
LPAENVQVLSLLVRHRCPFSGPLKEAPTARVTHLCHRGEDAILELHGSDPDAVPRLTAKYTELGGTVLYEERDRSAALVRFASCACCRSGRVIPALESLGQLYLPPSSYTSEGERYQFLAQGGTSRSALIDRLPARVSIAHLATRPLTSLRFEEGFLVPVGTFFRDITDRQLRALVTAILRGYYRIPRAVATEELARDFGISRAAFDTLLRKAENKLAAALFPYLTLRESGRAPATPGPAPRPSDGARPIP